MLHPDQRGDQLPEDAGVGRPDPYAHTMRNVVVAQPGAVASVPEEREARFGLTAGDVADRREFIGGAAPNLIAARRLDRHGRGGELDIITANIARFTRGVRAQNEWSRTARTCVDFVEGRQWTDEERALRAEQKRPLITINKLRPLVNMVTGFFTQNKRQIQFRPGNDFVASEQVADILNKLSQMVDESQQFEHIATEVFLDGINSGRGYFDQRISFERNILGEIVLRSADPFTIVPDPEAQSYDPADWGWVTEAKWMTFDEIAALYGGPAVSEAYSVANANAPLDQYGREDADLEQPRSYFGSYGDGAFGNEDDFFDLSNPILTDGGAFVHLIDPSRKLLRVIDTQHKRMEMSLVFVDLVTGATLPIDRAVWSDDKIRAAMALAEQMGAEQGLGSTLDVIQMRVPVWYWTATAGDRLLYHERSQYRRPTITPFFPLFRRGQTRGMIHDLLDPQTELNRGRTNLTEIVSKLAAGGWIYEEESMHPDQKQNLAQYGSTPGVHVVYRKGHEPPMPLQPGTPPQIHTVLEQLAGNDIKETAGFNDASLGLNDKVESGRAIRLRQQATVVGIEPYADRFERSLHLLGTARIGLFQDFYTEERVFRLRGDDGRDMSYSINTRMADGTLINDVTQGSYDVAVDTQPMTATQDDAAFDALMEMIGAGIPIPPEEILAVAPIPNRQRILEKVQMAQQMAQQMQQADAAVGGAGAAPAPSAAGAPV